jgi:hypothetical protein
MNETIKSGKGIYIPMELINNRRDEFRMEMNEFFEGIRGKGFKEIEAETRYRWDVWGIEYIGIRKFGETVILSGVWGDEGVSIEVNINPGASDEDFRVLSRWRTITE